eukprot:scaffold177482_cov18-Tisochrysis_lutea.AAC.5
MRGRGTVVADQRGKARAFCLISSMCLHASKYGSLSFYFWLPVAAAAATAAAALDPVLVM